tara:strand:+ start:342 stop:896 length:555 start_codon:yes stop_codon:yes gene_type:complete
MKTNYLKLFGYGMAMLVMGCSTVDPESAETKINLDAVKALASKGATQISGIGFFDEAAACDLVVKGEGADFALLLTGDLEGCLFVYVDSHNCSPSGTYRETGTEKFVGIYNGQFGTFETSYRFEAKYEGCDEDGFFFGAEIFGRCQHPITKESGTGVFDGVTGRLDFKDNVETGELPFRGHLKY